MSARTLEPARAQSRQPSSVATNSPARDARSRTAGAESGVLMRSADPCACGGGCPRCGPAPVLQRKPVEEHTECVEPLPAEAADEPVSFAEGISEFRGERTWLLRLWDFPKDDATVTIAHVAAMDAFFAAANLRAAQERIAHGWSVASVVGHASPEGDEDYNESLALARAED
jgi:hypothetical protein